MGETATFFSLKSQNNGHKTFTRLCSPFTSNIREFLGKVYNYSVICLLKRTKMNNKGWGSNIVLEKAKGDLPDRKRGCPRGCYSSLHSCR